MSVARPQHRPRPVLLSFQYDHGGDSLIATPLPPTEQVATALARTRDVYGIRRLSFDRDARTLRIEYDATRLNAAAVTKLVREAGLEIEEEAAAAGCSRRRAAAAPTA